MRPRRAASLAAALALGQAVPAAAQDRSPMLYAGAVFDVTGAGTLELGDFGAVLRPFAAEFDAWPYDLDVELTVDAAGAVTGCRITGGKAEGGRAGAAFCAHAATAGRFTVNPLLELDYTRATYRFSIIRGRAADGQETSFTFSEAYAPNYRPVVFGTGARPPETQSLPREAVEITPFDYPVKALRNEVTAAVVVVLTFDEAGMVARCRPVTSTSTAHIAYETCIAAARGARQRAAPDPRPFVLSVVWSLN